MRGEKADFRWPYTPSSERTVDDCFSCFDLCFKWTKRKKEMNCAVYSGYLEREMENISAHGPKKYT